MIRGFLLIVVLLVALLSQRSLLRPFRATVVLGADGDGGTAAVSVAPNTHMHGE
jgi:hypothetical protein